MPTLRRGLLIIGGIALGGAIVFPLYWALVASLTPESRLFKAPSLWPGSMRLDHYRALFLERGFLLPIRNSLIVAGATTGLCLLLGAPCAYALTRLTFRWKSQILGLILGATMFPPISILSPLYLLLRRLGLIDTYPGLVLPYVTFALPLAVWLLAGVFRQLPRDLEEAALVDGATRWQAFRKIVLPLATPGLAAAAILTFVYCWNEFLFALAFTLGPERQTVPVAIALFRGRYQVPWGQILAASIVATVPVVALVLAFQRRIVAGLTAGAVKGWIMGQVRLRGVGKTYPNGHSAIRNLDLDVTDGELLVLVGPSGCGKSTLLRLIAGLEETSHGKIFIGDRDVTDLPPRDRDVAMVFQSYALYPHLTVRDNLGFGLRVRKTPSAEIAQRVEEIGAMLDLTSVLDRRPRELSGGQRQRVALGRALVRRPAVFLLDEPLSNLDAALRHETRTELTRLHRRLGVTMLHVTHDQEEAMTLADRVAVLRDGAIEQIAPPLELYRAPATRFVASFIGSPAMNLIRGTVRPEPGGSWFESSAVTLPLDSMQSTTTPGEVWLGIRPHDLELVARDHGDASARVDLVEPHGSQVVLHLVLPDGTAVRSVTGPDTAVEEGAMVGLLFRRDRLHLFDAATDQRR
jgi:multiple sugar transport system ATP-binding protein